MIKKQENSSRYQIAGAPDGVEPFVIRALVEGRPLGEALTPGGVASTERKQDVIYIACDDVHLARVAEAMAFFAPDLEALPFPAWDCLPYDRVSPRTDIVGRRIETLTRLLAEDRPGRVVLTTVSSVLQRIPPKESFTDATLSVAAGQRLDPEALMTFLTDNGYGRAETVMEPGEFAVRGGIVDVFPSGQAMPCRLDFFGDEVEAIRAFDPTTQRSSGTLESLAFKPISEVRLDEASISRFRSEYRKLFGAVGRDDPLYEAVSAGRRHMGMEHWLALFYEKMETLFDFLPGAAVVLDHQAEEARDARLDLIAEYFTARANIAGRKAAGEGLLYNPVPPERLYLDGAGWNAMLDECSVGTMSPFEAPSGKAGAVNVGAKPGRDFADARVRPDVSLFEVVKDFVAAEQKDGRRVVISAFSHGARERLAGQMKDHGLEAVQTVSSWPECRNLPIGTAALAVARLERGFTAPALSVITEPDILGERLVRRARSMVDPENIITEASSLQEGDLVVHVDHGIGRFEGLESIQVAAAPHDCLRLVYAGGAKLYLPVENIEVISRYGSEEAGAQLDRLGGAAWQARKAKLKQRLRDMADELIGIAASRSLHPGAKLAPEEHAFNAFCARFPYNETDDQLRAIEDTLADLASGRPMDRLVCGDVGFGKTEVALRAAFAAVMTGKQVAVVVPTTLLARQHYQVFAERFADLPVSIAQLSRLVPAKDTKTVKENLGTGRVDIVVGTHALLAKDVTFKDLGLLIIDEEQHFGVAHKEKLKALKANVHVLTLTATPIPRTLQMALSGVRELSLIATPPVDRLAVRTFILPYDPVVIREAILRERFRGGQVFYVCPRIQDLAGVAKELKELVPDVKIAAVHGRMGPADLEETMTAFYDGSFDLLLSTNIIESGLDLPSVNTIVIHRADRFGLAQLYQLRGRVGRSKVRAYAYLTLPVDHKLTKNAEKRLEVMHTLDSLGAGFALASHDLDIRGAGNLLGEEQSGHIREVGIELYQQMLEEAVAEARGLGNIHDETDDWSPQIGIGMSVLIPDTYVEDLNVRLALYRRLASLTDPKDIESFAAELIDRFGPLPGEVENLMQIMAIKQLCKNAGVEKIEAGPKGAVVSFRRNTFVNPDGLVAFMMENAGTVKLRPDHTLVFNRFWETPGDRLGGVRHLLNDIASIAREGPKETVAVS
ncbi:MAG: transcription-repair coupling factor [Rhodospirillales bacterium]